MLMDLLRLASIGRNMELCAASLEQVRQQVRHQQSANQQQLRVSPIQINQQELDQTFGRPGELCERLIAQELPRKPRLSHQPAILPQCKPLDLSVSRVNCKRTSSSSSRKSARAARQELRIGKSSATSASVNVSISSSTSPSSSSNSTSSSSSSVSSALSKTSSSLRSEPISSTASSTRTSNDLKLVQQQQHHLHNNNQNQQQQQQRRGKTKSGKSHLCNECGRSFSRSDMLTRHSRLHSGLKPYQCGKCKQVFSRSDHLSTHERTHTGEKPYQCERCAYSACRRDMITRHMRTHSAASSSDNGRTLAGRRRKTARRRAAHQRIDRFAGEELSSSTMVVSADEGGISTSINGCDTDEIEEEEEDEVELI